MTMQEVGPATGPQRAPESPHLGRTGRTLWHTFVYVGGFAASRGAAILIIPILTRTLLPAEYALYDFCMMAVLFLNPFLNLGLQSAVLRYYFHYEQVEDQRRLYSTSLTFLSAVLVLSLGLLFGYSNEIARLVIQDETKGNLVRLVALISAASALSQQPLALIRGQEKSSLYSMLLFLRGLSGPAAIMLLAVFLKLGVVGALWGETAGLVVLTAAGLIAVRKWYVPAFNIAMLREMLAFGLPLIPSSIGLTIVFVSDRYILLHSNYDLASMAPYSLGFKVGMSISLLVQALQLSWQPAALQLAKEPGGRETTAKTFLVLQALLLALAMTLSAFAPEFTRIFAPVKGYAGAANVIPWIAFTYAVYGIVTLLTAAFGIVKQSFWSSIVFCTAAAVKLALAFYFIPRYGILGAAVTTFASFGIAFVLTYLVAQRLYPLPFNLRRFAATYLFSAFGLAGVLAVLPLAQPVSLLLRVLILALFMAGCYYLVLSKPDRDTLWQAGRKVLARIQPRQTQA
jgi:O-antigen/teichoic acid export membrane protein